MSIGKTMESDEDEGPQTSEQIMYTGNDENPEPEPEPVKEEKRTLGQN